MTCGPTIARWLAAMILAIVVLAPSVGVAHEGRHPGHHHGAHAAAKGAPAAAIQAARAESAWVTRDVVLRADPADRAEACAPHGPCSCCGAACCAPGILSAAAALPVPAADNAVLRPRDAPDAAGRGPESLAEPPRPLA